MKYLKKRDGSIVLFESDKIRNAMSKAFVACMIISGIDMLDEYTDAVCKKLGETGKDTIDIEDVQNEVERVLMGAGRIRSPRNISPTDTQGHSFANKIPLMIRFYRW